MSILAMSANVALANYADCCFALTHCNLLGSD